MKKPKPKAFLEPFEKKAYWILCALLLLCFLCYWYVFAEYVAYGTEIDRQTVTITEFIKENTR